MRKNLKAKAESLEKKLPKLKAAIEKAKDDEKPLSFGISDASQYSSW